MLVDMEFTLFPWYDAKVAIPITTTAGKPKIIITIGID